MKRSVYVDSRPLHLDCKSLLFAALLAGLLCVGLACLFLL